MSDYFDDPESSAADFGDAEAECSSYEPPIPQDPALAGLIPDVTLVAPAPLITAELRQLVIAFFLAKAALGSSSLASYATRYRAYVMARDALLSAVGLLAPEERKPV